MPVARTDHSNILWNPQARLRNRPHRPNRHRIVVAEHSIGDGWLLQQLAHGAVAGAIHVACPNDVARSHRQVMFLESMPIASHPGGRNPNLETTQVCDSSATLCDQ